MGGGELVTGECREMGQEAARKGYRERHRREKGIRGGQGRKERVGVLAFKKKKKYSKTGETD